MQNNLNVHIQEKHDQGHKSNPETDLTPDSRHKAIQDNFANNAKRIGFGPITKEKLDNVHYNMIRRGVISNKEPYNLWMQRTIKSYIKTWAMTNLKMKEEEWNTIKV